jgi:hypothetical protein
MAQYRTFMAGLYEIAFRCGPLFCSPTVADFLKLEGGDDRNG